MFKIELMLMVRFRLMCQVTLYLSILSLCFCFQCRKEIINCPDTPLLTCPKTYDHVCTELHSFVR